MYAICSSKILRRLQVVGFKTPNKGAAHVSAV